MPLIPLGSVRDFLRMEAAGGIILVVASAIALLLANSPWERYYQELLHLKLQFSVGSFALGKPLFLWINDGLMTIFFFLVGLEIKRELREGELSTPVQAILPLIAAIGGMICPALIYALLNRGDADALRGWAIPAATDIAFALGVLSLLGSRVPIALKVMLTAIAIFDDVGAILIIAVFYTEQLSILSLSLAGVALALVILFNFLGVNRMAPYLVVGAVLWLCVLKSGVHATLAGVLLAFCIPLYSKEADQPSLLKVTEHGLHRWVAFGVLPIFGFANAGVSFEGIGFDSVLHPITLGIIAGLFVGKQIGIFTFIWLAVQTRVARMPEGVTWGHIYGLSVLCGIGFTMSLFIGGLAWPHAEYEALVRLGVIGGSLCSAIVGMLILRLMSHPATQPAPA